MAQFPGKNGHSTWWDERRFGVRRILAMFDTHAAAAEFFGTTERTIMRWQAHGVDWLLADDIATKLWRHPADVWEGWDDLPPEAFDENCGGQGDQEILFPPSELEAVG